MHRRAVTFTKGQEQLSRALRARDFLVLCAAGCILFARVSVN
jgi:hypothetical protein